MMKAISTLMLSVSVLFCILLSGTVGHELDMDPDFDLDHMNPMPVSKVKLELGPDIVKFPCIPLVWNKPMLAEQIARIEQFQREWFDTKRFPALKISTEERAWLLNRTVLPLPRTAMPQFSRSDSLSSRGGSRKKRHATGSNPDCYEIPTPIRTRKEYRQLTNLERSSYHAAINAMKSDFPFPITDPTLSAYDFLVRLHRYTMAPAAHRGAAFLPWHREYLFIYENTLFEYGFSGPGLPYWDSTLDQSLPDPSASALWTSSYMGNNDGNVISGPAGGWDVVPECHSGSNTKLRRNTMTGSMGNSYLLSDSNINYVNGKQCFKDISCNEDCYLENRHGSVHVFVNGHMASVTCAPSDPIFYMHHAFVDCIWEDFRRHHQETDPETEYPSSIAHGDNIGSGGGLAHEWNSPMQPFDNVINAHGMSNHYTNYYYQCRRRPRFCFGNSQCGSSILWCDTTACRCRAKVRQGGDCTGLPHKACAGPCPFGKYPRCNSLTNICDCQSFIVIGQVALPDKTSDANTR